MLFYINWIIGAFLINYNERIKKSEYFLFVAKKNGFPKDYYPGNKIIIY